MAKEFSIGIAASERERYARNSDDYRNLYNAVVNAAVEAYREAIKRGNVEGAAYLRFHGGITAIMKKAAAANDRSYVGVFNVPRRLSELLNFNTIRNEALKKAKEGK